MLSFRRFYGRRDFGGETLGHLAIAFALGDFLTVIQSFDRARDFALAKQYAGLAKDARVTFSFFGGIHDG